MTNQELVELAAKVVNQRKNGDFLIGDVGAALETTSGNVYQGVCIDAPSGLGFCAEASAIGAMTTAGESRIKRIVAVWQGDDGDIRILPPCGRCREFIRQIDERNLDAEVLLADDLVLLLRYLLPHHDGFADAT